MVAAVFDGKIIDRRSVRVSTMQGSGCQSRSRPVSQVIPFEAVWKSGDSL